MLLRASERFLDYAKSRLPFKAYADRLCINHCSITWSLRVSQQREDKSL